MLSVMLFSGWLFLTVVFSMGIGYFFFGHIATKINMESIQARTTRVICAPSCSQACAEAGTSSMWFYSNEYTALFLIFIFN